MCQHSPWLSYRPESGRFLGNSLSSTRRIPSPPQGMNMRITLSAFRLPVLAALLLALWVSIASAADPIPGIDIIVKRNPGGVVVKQVTTGKKGEYLIENLEPGSYTLDVQPGPKTTTNTSRSNIKKPDRPPVKNGVETHVVDIEFGTSKEKKAHAPVTFEVKEKSGTISGVITQEAPPEKAPK